MQSDEKDKRNIYVSYTYSSIILYKEEEVCIRASEYIKYVAIYVQG